MDRLLKHKWYRQSVFILWPLIANEQQSFKSLGFSSLVIWTNGDFAGVRIFIISGGEWTFGPLTYPQLAKRERLGLLVLASLSLNTYGPINESSS